MQTTPDRVVVGVVVTAPFGPDALDGVLSGHVAEMVDSLFVGGVAERSMADQLAWARRELMREGTLGAFWVGMAPASTTKESAVTKPAQLRLYLIAAQQPERVYLREIPLVGDRRAWLETLSIVIRVQIENLLQGHSEGMRPAMPEELVDEPPDDPPPLPENSAPPETQNEAKAETDLPAEPPYSWGIGALGIASMFDPASPVYGGARAFFELRSASGLSIGLFGGWQSGPASLSEPAFVAHIAELTVALGFHHRWKAEANGPWSTGAELQWTAQRVFWSTSPSMVDIHGNELRAASWRFAPGMRAVIDRRLGRSESRWSVRLRLGADIWVRNFEIRGDVDEEENEVLLLRPYTASAAVELGFRVRL